MSPKTLNVVAQTIGALPPASYNTAQTLGWYDMGQFEQVRFLINVGVIASSGTLDAAVQQATTNSGTNSKALSPAKAITQLTQAGGGSNKYVEIVVRSTDLDINNRFRFVQLTLTPAVAAAIVGVTVEGSDIRSSPQNGGFTALQESVSS